MAKRGARTPPRNGPVDEPLLKLKRNGRAGRPSYEWTERGRETFRALVLVANTLEDIAGIFRVSLSWLEKQVADDEELRLLYAEAKAERRSQLRTWQYQAAKRLNPTMLIWLGKTDLGQRDYRALEVTGPGGGPLEVQSEIKPLLEQKLQAFLRSKQNREAVRTAVGGGRRKGNSGNGEDTAA